jgi:hypothetical protein
MALGLVTVKERTFPRMISKSSSSYQDRRWPAGSGRYARVQGSPGRVRAQQAHPRGGRRAALGQTRREGARCPSPLTRAPRPRSRRSSTPRTRTTRSRPPRPSRPTTAPSGPRRSPRSPTTSTCCSRSTTSPPSTGSASARPTHRVDFPTVRLRQRVTKGPGSRAAGVAMAFKLIESAQAGWRAVNALTWSRWESRLEVREGQARRTPRGIRR